MILGGTRFDVVTVHYCSLSFHMLSVMRGMALAPHLATFNYFSPLPVASLGGSPPSFISSLDCEETRDLAYGENHRQPIGRKGCSTRGRPLSFVYPPPSPFSAYVLWSQPVTRGHVWTRDRLACNKSLLSTIKARDGKKRPRSENHRVL